MEIAPKKLALKVEARDFGQQRALKLKTDNVSSKELILQFLLLREKLVDSIEVMFDNFTIYLKLNNHNKSVCSLCDFKKNILKGSISLNSLEYLMYFLLKYYREGIGEAEHIDIDFEYTVDCGVTLTVEVDSFTEYSAEEMNRRLGI